MRVAIIQEEVDLRRGGAETSTLEMARHLALLGLDVTVIHRDPRSKGIPAGAPTPGVDEVHFRPVAADGASRALRTYRFVQAANRVCRDARFDIVHAVTPCLAANVYQPRGGTFTETIARSTAMNPAWLRELKRLGRRFNIRQRFLFRLERVLLSERRKGVYVAALSDYVQRQVVELGFPAERVRVVFNGVDVPALELDDRTTRRAALGWPETVPLVLFVAHNFKLKGLRELLWAAASAASEWGLVVAGRDDPRPYQRLADRLGLTARVRFVGTQTPVAAWYAVADVLAHPTWYDPCSRVVLEALSLGLPVVTTRYNGAAEVMEEGRHGVVIDKPSDVAALAAGIDSALQPRIHDACRADAPRLSARLSMARHARELMALYEYVLAAK
jgi:UDP-glucose:(heptosyl)LPS alpha-1,3-glucosyltransferase